MASAISPFTLLNKLNNGSGQIFSGSFTTQAEFFLQRSVFQIVLFTVNRVHADTSTESIIILHRGGGADSTSITARVMAGSSVYDTIYFNATNVSLVLHASSFSYYAVFGFVTYFD